MLDASLGWETLRVVQHALSLVCFPAPAVVHHAVDVTKFIIVVITPCSSVFPAFVTVLLYTTADWSCLVERSPSFWTLIFAGAISCVCVL